MKKTWFVLALAAVLAVFMVGCNVVQKDNGDNSCGNGCSADCKNECNTGGNNDTEKAPEELPTFAEIIAFNQLDNVLKTHSNAYVHSVYSAEGKDTVEDLICFKGDGKADYHQRTKNSDSEEYEYTSGVGNVRYRVNESSSIILEIGDLFFSKISYLEMDTAVQVGKGYIENDKIVYHAYQIVEGNDEFTAQRYDHTFYFNKDTKLIEKLDYVGYDSEHKAFCEYRSETSYSVDVESKLGTTAYEIMMGSEHIIELEVIEGYNTPEQRTYNLTVPYDADLTLIIDKDFYALFSDVEHTNLVMTLEDFVGEEKVTLYAVSYNDFEEVRYTVTAEEWEALTDEYNYTFEWIVDGESSGQDKYTKDVIQIGESIILFVGDKQYMLEETERGWVAYDCTDMEFAHDGSFVDYAFEDCFYDESICAYVNKNYEEIGERAEIRFENGKLISVTYHSVDPDDGEVNEYLYTNIGETVIDVPEFTFYYDLEPDPAKLATEEIWNRYAGEKNFTALLVESDGTEYVEHTLKSTEDAFELDGKIIVFEAGKGYALEKRDGAWYAVEYEGIALPESLLPKGLGFDDFEYDAESEMYVQKNAEDADFFYSVAFENGAPVYVQIGEAPDPSNPGYIHMIALMISEIGSADVDVPEYVIDDAE